MSFLSGEIRDRVIALDVFVAPVMEGVSGGDVEIFSDVSRRISCRAIFDTGATETCLSSSIVDKLGLESYGVYPIDTAAGVVASGAYDFFVNIPMRGSSPDFYIFGGDFDSGDSGIDVLVGMDIIMRGLLTVSSSGTFSFSV